MLQSHSTFVCSMCLRKVSFGESTCWVSSKTNKLECNSCINKELIDEAYNRAMKGIK